MSTAEECLHGGLDFECLSSRVCSRVRAGILQQTDKYWTEGMYPCKDWGMSEKSVRLEDFSLNFSQSLLALFSEL